MDVLRWVAGGCPDGVWQDYSYKVTAYALAGRGLVKVDRRRDSWSAAITDDGRYYLDHGGYPHADSPAPPTSNARARPTPRIAFPLPATPPVTPESLLDELARNDGVLTVADPPREVRAAYRSAISRAITEGLVPKGCGLRHKGRDRGDLIIRLVRLDDKRARPGPVAAILVPEDLRDCHQVVAALRDTPRLLPVSDGARDRALRIAQAIAAECERRGYQFGLRADGEPSFQVSVGQDRFEFTLAEEFEARELPDPEKFAAARYDWQRIPSVIRQVPSGRLVLRLWSSYRQVSWADRQRWVLEQKLPAVFKALEDQAAAQAGERQRKEDERQQRHRAWEEAVPRARRAYVEELNRDRLREQAARSAEAEAIRGYCSRLESLATDCGDPEQATRIREWAAWARREAGRIDPVSRPGKLAYLVPEKIEEQDFDKFMPQGMSAWHPPG